MIGKSGVDLHIHSDVSDGFASCEEIVQEARKLRLSQLVFTEHNCFHDNLEDVIHFAEQNAIKIPFWGCECTTVLSLESVPSYKIHILIYGKDRKSFEFLDLFPDINGYAKMLVYERYMQAHKNGDISVEFEEMYQCKNQLFHSKKYMYTYDVLLSHIVSAGMKSEVAQQVYPPISDEERYRVWADTRSIIKKAHEAGCICAWAHPGWIRPFYNNKTIFQHEKLLCFIASELYRSGIDGIEVGHQRNSKDDQALLLDFAKEKGLYVTGGSDYHAKPGRQLGCNRTENVTVEKMIERIQSY